MPVAREYLWIWFWWTVVLLGSVAAINVLIDPYGLFRVVDVPGLNRLKSQASERGPLFKHANVTRVQPKTLILGNSRAEIGFDPDSLAWPDAARPVFNLALPGAGVGAVAGDFARALRGTNPELAVVGLDFVDFRVDPKAGDSFRLAQGAGDRWRDLLDRSSAVLTLTAFADSLATVRAQHEPLSTGLTDAGFNPKHDYTAIARREGYFALFRQRDQENALNYSRGPKSVFQRDGRASPGFDAVDSIIAQARARGIALRFVIYPYHAHTLVLFHLAGLWPAYEDWKRELVRRVDAARETADVELWDFTAFSPYADERIPSPGDTRSELAWYWEAGHFKKALGDIVLARMFGAQGTLGSRLAADMLETHLADQAAARLAYETTHREDVADLATLVARAPGR